ncbi:MAG: hypothetical protein ACRDZ2_13580 [Ilumatobacteraceae bacterium]
MTARAARLAVTFHRRPTPVGAVFDRVAERWAEVPDDGTLTVSWPTLELEPARP